MRIRDHLLGGPLGFGSAPLGNMFRQLRDDEAAATVEAAWARGTRLFDTAPYYGAGLAELRLGRALANHPRDKYLLSTKVGRLILDEVDTRARDFGEQGGLFAFGRPNRLVYDYSGEGTNRSLEESMRRMGVDRFDLVWVHDVAQDFHGDEWLACFDSARRGAFRRLAQLRDEGRIRAWGLGVNRVEPCELALSLAETRPDALLLAGRYTLIDHARALQRLMPEAAAQGVDILVGGPYSSGVLAGGSHFEHQPAPPEIRERVARLQALAQRHGVPLKAAALQFALAHPAVAAVIPGASRPARIAEDHAALVADIPDAFWHELREHHLVAAEAPLPIDRHLVRASASIDIAASPEQVWSVIGGFDSLPDWLPGIPKSELSDGGRVRHLATPSGDTVVERLEAFDNAAHSYSYSILQAPFPVTDYRSTLRVDDADGGERAHVEWTARFRPRGVSEREAAQLFQHIYERGLQALAGGFAAKRER